MTKIRVLICTLAFTILMLGSVNAQQLGGSTGDYYTDLGAILGAVEAVKLIKDICNQDFPETASSNEKYYADWRTKNFKFLQEVERNHTRVINEYLKISVAKAVEYQSTFNKTMSAFKAQQRKDMASDGLAGFRAKCANYGELSQSQQWNLQSSMAEEVATMRKSQIK